MIQQQKNLMILSSGYDSLTSIVGKDGTWIFGTTKQIFGSTPKKEEEVDQYVREPALDSLFVTTLILITIPSDPMDKYVNKQRETRTNTNKGLRHKIECFLITTRTG